MQKNFKNMLRLESLFWFRFQMASTWSQSLLNKSQMLLRGHYLWILKIRGKEWHRTYPAEWTKGHLLTYLIYRRGQSFVLLLVYLIVHLVRLQIFEWRSQRDLCKSNMLCKCEKIKLSTLIIFSVCIILTFGVFIF